MHQLSLAV
jgi:hypothetical protein